MKDGGPAFPHEADYIRKAVGDGGGYEFKVDFHPGMSLRDWFAGQAFGGLATALAGKFDHCSADIEVECEELADIAYTVADAMLAAREQPTTEPTEEK